jgi:hypothetical protein
VGIAHKPIIGSIRLIFTSEEVAVNPLLDSPDREALGYE